MEYAVLFGVVAAALYVSSIVASKVFGIGTATPSVTNHWVILGVTAGLVSVVVVLLGMASGKISKNLKEAV